MATVYLTKRNGEVETRPNLNFEELQDVLRMNKDEYLAIEIDEDEECEDTGIHEAHSNTTIHYL